MAISGSLGEFNTPLGLIVSQNLSSHIEPRVVISDCLDEFDISLVLGASQNFFVTSKFELKGGNKWLLEANLND